MNKRHGKLILLISILAIMIVLGFYLWPLVTAIATETGRDQLVNYMRSKEIMGVIIFVLIQIIQVVIFVIPGEFIEVIAGMVYGPLWGYVLCQIGMIIACVIIFYLVKYVGYDFIVGIIGEKKFNEFSFLKDSNKVGGLIAVLYFIPGTPKDALTYFVPFTNISLIKFLIISTIARFPSVISSTMAGSSFQSGEYGDALFMFALIAMISIFGIVINKKFMKNKR